MSTAPSSIPRDGRVVLISCYELGQQPLGLAVPAGLFARAGIRPTLLDLSIEVLTEDILANADFVGISVPMHTALRLGVRAARRVRGIRPRAHICFYGMYAGLNAPALEEIADSCLGAEYEVELVELVERVLDGSGPPVRPTAAPTRSPNRSVSLLPDRSGLSHPDRYVRLAHAGALERVGYTAATRGCRHLCRHCPLPPVYHGSFYAIPVEDVLTDVEALVAGGARHVTFADPDFLNGPTHARRIGRGMRERFPGITFDYTAKIEHLRARETLVEELQECGNLFVVSAVESLSDNVLATLAKGHTRQDALDVFEHFRRIGLTLRPTLVPFTPWETLESYIGLLDTIAERGLVDNVDAVQYSVRLLVPPGSLLLDSEEMKPYLGTLDAERFTWRWTHPDARMDTLCETVAGIAADAAKRAESASQTFERIRHAAGAPTGRAGAAPRRIRGHAGDGAPPRLTEAWFC